MPTTDPEVRQLATSRLTDLFQGIGHARQENDPSALGNLGGITGQIEEFMSMPMDLAVLFLDMSVQLAELVLTSLEEGGVILVKGLTPA